MKSIFTSFFRLNTKIRILLIVGTIGNIAAYLYFRTLRYEKGEEIIGPIIAAVGYCWGLILLVLLGLWVCSKLKKMILSRTC